MRFASNISLLLLIFSDFSTAEVTEVSKLDFGKIVLADNNLPYQVIVNRDGESQYIGNIFPISQPERAEFYLTNFPINTIIFITATNIQATSNSKTFSNEQFTLENIDIPKSIVTDPNGTATLYVGGTLQSSGSGSNGYSNTDYSLKYQLEITY